MTATASVAVPPTDTQAGIGGDRSDDATLLRSLVSAHVGVIHRADAGVISYDHPRLAPVYAQACDLAPLAGISYLARAGGMATDARAAELAALGEAVERYSASHVPQSRLRHATADDLAGEDAVAPLRRGEPRDADRSATLPWVRGTRLLPRGPGSDAWVAAARAYLREFDGAGESEGRPIVPSTSTGLACHRGPWQALRSALLEVVERDAVMITWLTRCPARPIRTELRWRTQAGTGAATHVRFDLAVERYQLYLLDSPTHVPVVFAVAFGAAGQPAAAVGAAADLDLASACRRALVEARQTFELAVALQAGGVAPPAGPHQVLDLDDHVAYYLPLERADAFAFLDADSSEPVEVDLDAARTPGPPEPEVRALVEHAERAGMACYAVDVTSPDVRAAGLWVVRAVVPELYPLLVGTGQVPPHPRLPGDLPINPDPHPFP